MNRKFSVPAAGVFVVALSCSAYAGIAQIEGKWKNVDTQTSGVTSLDIKVNGDKVTVRAWGSCKPTDCDWGTVVATPYGPGVGSALPGDARTLSAVFKTAFNETLMVIDMAEGRKLRVEVLTRFTDNSGRSAYSTVDKFAR